MLIVLTFFMFAAAFYNWGSSTQNVHFAAPLHQACSALSFSNHLTELTRAVICSDPQALRHLRAENSGSNLGHLLTLSGFHIFAIEAICLRSSSKLRVVALIYCVIFDAMMGWPLRLSRLAFQIFLERVNLKWQLRWTPVQIITVASVSLIPLLHSRADFSALLLGWIAALASRGFSRARRGWRYVRTYLLMAPALLPFSLPHPLSIFATLACAPALCLVWPLALVEMAVGQPLPVWPFLQASLSAIETWMPAPFSPCAISEIFLLAYIAVLSWAAA